MPKALMVGENCLTFDIAFSNVKSGQGYFINSQGKAVSFNVKPSIQLSVDSNSTSIPYTFSFLKTGSLFTGLVVKFNTFYTGNVTVTVLEN